MRGLVDEDGVDGPWEAAMERTPWRGRHGTHVADVKYCLGRAEDADVHTGALLKSREMVAAAECKGEADLWRVRAVAALVRWVRS